MKIYRIHSYFRASVCVLMTGFLFLSSCSHKDNDEPLWKATPYTIDIPPYFPLKLNIPDDNPMTKEGIALGRFLFYDGRLSGRTVTDSLMSCGSCHIQVNNFRPGLNNQAFENGMPHGIRGTNTKHAALPLINLVWNQSGYTWNGAVDAKNANGNLESIVIETIMHPAELAGDTTMTVDLLQSINGYPDLFYKAFGSKVITADRIAKAIAQFLRTLVSANSRFDKYMRGELQLTNDELEGLILFTTEEGADCFHCHGSSGNPLFTTSLFYNNGKDTIFNSGDDRFSITGNVVDIGAYKATTLRNIATGGPYMHDGRFFTLDEVIDFYSHNLKMSDHISPLMHHVEYGGIQLLPLEKTQLKSFLESLTDHDFINNSDFSAPSIFPDGKSYQEVRGKF